MNHEEDILQLEVLVADILAVHVGDGLTNLKKLDLGNLQPDTRTCKWFHGCCTKKISFSISPVSHDGQHQLPAVVLLHHLLPVLGRAPGHVTQYQCNWPSLVFIAFSTRKMYFFV